MNKSHMFRMLEKVNILEQVKEGVLLAIFETLLTLPSLNCMDDELSNTNALNILE